MSDLQESETRVSISSWTRCWFRLIKSDVLAAGESVSATVEAAGSAAAAEKLHDYSSNSNVFRWVLAKNVYV